jgi:hypothetical protein
MEKVIIKEIKINAKGKSKEELKAEAMKEIEKQLNDAFKDVKEPKKEEEEPAKLHIHIDEDANKGGYGCETEICGDVDSVLDMTACAMATMAQQISQATAGTISPVGVIPEVMMRTASLLFEEGEEK